GSGAVVAGGSVVVTGGAVPGGPIVDVVVGALVAGASARTSVPPDGDGTVPRGRSRNPTPVVAVSSRPARSTVSVRLPDPASWFVARPTSVASMTAATAIATCRRRCPAGDGVPAPGSPATPSWSAR